MHLQRKSLSASHRPLELNKLKGSASIWLIVRKTFPEYTTMSSYLDKFKGNIRLADNFLRPLNQGILNPNNPKSVIVRNLQRWPMWYIASCVTFYLYLIFGERAGLVNISEQIWCLMTISQVLVKIINHLLQSDKVKDILRWCEELYTTQYKPEYQVVEESVFQKTNSIIGLCIRCEKKVSYSLCSYF